MLPPAVFYANAGSRRTQDDFDTAVSELQSAGVELQDSQAFEDIHELQDAIQTAATQGTELTIVGGGDGTLSAAASVVSQTSATLGVMPLGTGNQFARELGLDLTIAEAAQTIAQGRTCQIDLSTINGQRFINVATIGVTTEIARSLKFKRQLGVLAYIPAVVHSFQNMKPFQVHLEAGNVVIDEEAVLLVVANGRTHGGPFLASPEANLTDGLMDAYMVNPGGFWQMAQVGAMALTGEHVELDPVHLVQAEKMTVSTDPKRPVTIDGETTWFDSLEFSILPAALRVCVPKSFRGPAGRLGSLLEDNESESTTDA